MITLHVTRAGELEGAHLRLPASEQEVGEFFSWLDEISADSSTTKILEAISNVYNLGKYIKTTNVENPAELAKLNSLATKLQTMDRESCLKFEGVLDANSVNGVDDMLRLADSLGDYALLPDAHNASALGKYLVANEIVAFPESVRPYLDHQIIGQEFYADHGGAFCRAGYAVRWDELPQQFHQTPDGREGVYPITLRLRTNAATVDMPLPATEIALDQAKRRLDIDEFAEANILVVDYVYPYLAQMIPQECISVEDANELAEAITQMNQTDGELLKYLSVLEVEQPDTFQEALNLAIDLDDYERVPADPEEYGCAVLERLGADEEIINSIDGFMDFADFGREWMREDGVMQTEFGLLRRLSEPFATPEMAGMEMQ